MADELKTKAIIEIEKQGTGAQEAVRDIERIGSVATAVGGSLKSLGMSVAGFFAAAGITSFVSSSIAEYAEAEAGINRLNGALRARGQYAAQYSEDLQSLAGSLQDVSNYTDDAILALEQQLVTAGASRYQIEQLTRASIDLAAGMGIDLAGAAHMMGRAINGETVAFSKLGFSIRENATDAQKLEDVLRQVQQRFGGMAENETKTLIGQTTALSKAWADLKEKVGSFLASDALGVTGSTATAIRGTLSIFERSDQIASAGRQIMDAQSAIVQGRATGTVDDARSGALLDELNSLRSRGIGEGAAPDQYLDLARRMREVAGVRTSAEGLPAPGSGQMQYRPPGDQWAEPVPVEGGQSAIATPGLMSAEEVEAERMRIAQGNEDFREQQLADEALYEANRLQLARDTHEEMRSLEAELSIAAIGSTETRREVAEREYQARVELYEGLRETGQITEEELTSLSRQASEERRRVLAAERTAQQVLTEGFRSIGREGVEMASRGLAQAFVSIANGTKSAGDAFKQFASNFLSSLAEMILQLIIFATLKRALAGTTFGSFIGMAGGGVAMAAEGGSFPGVSEVSQPTYFPKFNVLAGEAGSEMLTVFSKPQVTRFAGLPAVVGNVGAGNRMALVPAGGAGTMAASSAPGGGGVTEIIVRMSPGLVAEIAGEGARGGVRLVQEALDNNTPISRRVKAVAQS